MKRLYTLIGFLLSLGAMAQQVPNTAGTRFWLAYMENISLVFNGTPDFGVVVSTFDQAANVTVSVPATGLELDFSVPANSTAEYMLPEAIWYSQVTEVVEGKGVLIESDVPVEISSYHYRIFFCDAARILPESELSDEYVVMAVRDLNSNSPSTLVIAATEDNTTVEITPSVLTQGLHPGGIAFNIQMDAGDIYQIHASTDLTGTVVRSSNGEKLAVFSGAQQADVYCVTDDSHHWEQTPPLSNLGRQYFLLPYLTQGGDQFKVMATEDSTSIYLDCELVDVLNEGEFAELFLTSPARLDADKAVMVAQLNTSGDCNPQPGGPSFAILHPFELRTRNSSWYASNTPAGPYDEALFDKHYVHVLIETIYTSEVSLDGSALSFSAFPGNPQLSYAALEVQPGSHRIESTQPFWAQVYGLNMAEAYTHSLGYNERVPFSAVSLAAAGSPTTGEFCAGETVSFAYSFVSDLFDWDWQFGDGGGSSEATPDYIYEEPGTYDVSFSAQDAQGCIYLGTLQVTIEDCSVGVTEQELQAELIWQSGSRLVVRNGKAADQLRVYDLSGRIVHQQVLNQGSVQVDLSLLAQGLYIAQLQSGTVERSIRLVKE